MKSTGSVWKVSQEQRFPAIEGDLSVDVVIVGAGITGLTAALILAEAGKRVAVLEARTVGSGVSGRTTAHLTEAIDARYATIEAGFGREGARLVAQSSRAAIETIGRIATRLALDSRFETVPGWLYTEQEEGRALLAAELDASRRAGLVVAKDERVPLPFATKGGIRYENQAQLDAGAYIEGLTRAVTDLGGRIFEHTRVIAVDDGEPCAVHVEAGAQLETGAVFFATDAALHRYFLQTKVSPFRSYVLAYRAGAGLAPGLFWDTADPYHYIRRAIVDDEEWLLVGGSDHRTGTETDTEKHYDDLAHYVHQRFGLAGPVHRWSAQVHEPIDGLPFIGKRPMGAHVYFATGFSGNGTTFGTIAATIVSDLVLGRANAWAELYAASRIKPIAGGRDFVRETVEDAFHFVSDWVRGAEASNVEDVGRGEGKIVRVNGRRLAVYRDDHGTLSALSPVCTHLGCHVHFNAAERSWDCACHGSRYDVDGTVLHGPAARALAKKTIEARPLTPQPVREERPAIDLEDPSLSKA